MRGSGRVSTILLCLDHHCSSETSGGQLANDRLGPIKLDVQRRDSIECGDHSRKEPAAQQGNLDATIDWSLGRDELLDTGLLVS